MMNLFVDAFLRAADEVGLDLGVASPAGVKADAARPVTNIIVRDDGLYFTCQDHQHKVCAGTKVLIDLTDSNVDHAGRWSRVNPTRAEELAENAKAQERLAEFAALIRQRDAEAAHTSDEV